MAQPEPTAPFEGTEKNLVFALTEIWDVGTLAWVKNEGGGTGGGGAVTIADGADVTQGAKADAAWVSGDGTVIAILKTIAAGGAGLTDAQLRATPVPVSGTVTANLAAGTNNIGDVDVLSLPALPAGTNNIGDVDIVSMPTVTIQDGGNTITVDGTVAVSGSVAVTGPLTDAELRATPVPVSGTVVANPTGYVIRLDEASSTITYVGQAAPGTATSSAAWSIKRLDSTSGLVVLWGAGTAAFNQIWDDRAALAYS